jgi:methanogenic corrinoid protein MtbC1
MQGGEVTRLARQAIAALAASGPLCSGGVTSSGFVARMSDAFIADDAEARHEVLQSLRQGGVSRADLVDHVIPAVARRLGERWFADDISFADVTIGAARLQESVHTLGRRAARPRAPACASGAILLVIPRGEDHTLGSFVLADQWRRQGFVVEVAVDRPPARIGEMLRGGRHCMLGITASGRRTLASARELVKTVRCMTARLPPVVVGGPILDKDLDVLALTGADHVARDAATALERCGLVPGGQTTPPGEEPGRAGDGVPVAGGEVS